MSLFIEALAKQIFKHMKYRDDEINELTRKVNSCVLMCDDGHESDVSCRSCNVRSCYDCLYFDPEWIGTTLTNEGDKVIEIKNQDNLDLETAEDEECILDHYLYCSQVCFKKYFNEPAIVGNIYRRCHLCDIPSFSRGDYNGVIINDCCGECTRETQVCDQCNYKMCIKCYMSKYENIVN